MLHPDGELCIAKAAGKMDVPFIMSTAATRSLEDAAQANGDGPRWYQLYWFVYRSSDRKNTTETRTGRARSL